MDSLMPVLNNNNIIVILHREKCSVLPASALALSTALLTAKRTEELRAIGGSPTASKQKQKDNWNIKHNVVNYCRVFECCKYLLIPVPQWD